MNDEAMNGRQTQPFKYQWTHNEVSSQSQHIRFFTVTVPTQKKTLSVS